MVKLLERLKKSIQKKQRVSESEAIAFATSILQKNGYLNKNGELTPRGRIKQRLPEGTKGLGKLTALKTKLKNKYTLGKKQKEGFEINKDGTKTKYTTLDVNHAKKVIETLNKYNPKI